MGTVTLAGFAGNLVSFGLLVASDVALYTTSVHVDARALALLGVGSAVGAVLGARFGAKVGRQAMIVTLVVATVAPGVLLVLGVRS